MIKIIQETDSNSVILASQHLKDGGILAFATDTVYGFGVDASNCDAVSKLYEIKKRDKKKAIAVLLRDLTRAQELLSFSDKALSIAKKFLPGPLTMILPLKDDGKELANNLNVIDSYIGFRVVDKDFIIKLFEKYQGDVALTSANLSNESVYGSAKEIYENFFETELDLLVVDSGELKDNLVSQIVKIDNDKLEILREGIIGKENICYETS